MGPVDQRLGVVPPVDGQHDGGEEREVGDGEDEPHSELGVVRLSCSPVRAGGTTISGLTGAG